MLLQVVVLLGLLFRPPSCRRTHPWLVPLLLLLLLVEDFRFCFGYCSWSFRFSLFLCTTGFRHVMGLCTTGFRHVMGLCTSGFPSMDLCVVGLEPFPTCCVVGLEPFPTFQFQIVQFPPRAMLPGARRVHHPWAQRVQQLGVQHVHHPGAQRVQQLGARRIHHLSPSEALGHTCREEAWRTHGGQITSAGSWNHHKCTIKLVAVL